MLLGIDIGGTGIQAALVEEDLTIVDFSSIATQADCSSEREILESIATQIEELLDKHSMTIKEIRAIGLGSPGSCDPSRGLVLFAGNLPFKQTPITAFMEERFSCPSFLGNDANLAALAEDRIGAGRGAVSSLMLTLGTGVGGGVVLNERIYAGFNGVGCEIGHVILKAGGKACTCGQRGCIEAYCAAPALVMAAKEKIAEFPHSILAELSNKEEILGAKIVFDAASEACPVAEELRQNYMRDLSDAVASLINAYLPEKVILGGGISQQGEPFRKELEQLTLAKVFPSGDLAYSQIVLAELGNKAGMIGAALYAQDSLKV